MVAPPPQNGHSYLADQHGSLEEPLWAKLPQTHPQPKKKNMGMCVCIFIYGHNYIFYTYLVLFAPYNLQRGCYVLHMLMQGIFRIFTHNFHKNCWQSRRKDALIKNVRILYCTLDYCTGTQYFHTYAHDKSHCAVFVHPPGLEESRNKGHHDTQYTWMYAELR